MQDMQSKSSLSESCRRRCLLVLACEAGRLKLLDAWIEALRHCQQVVYTLVQETVGTQHLRMPSVQLEGEHIEAVLVWP